MKSETDALVERAILATQEAVDPQEFSEAEALLQQISNVGASTPDTEHMLAFALHQQGKCQQAKEILESLVKEHTNWKYFNTLGTVCSTMGNGRGAIHYFGLSCGLGPKSPKPYSNMGLEYHYNGQCGLARHYYNMGLKALDEPNAMLLFYLGNTYIDDLNLAPAISCWEKAVAVDPMSSARWNLAMALLMDKQHERGWVEYESRFQHFPYFKQVKDSYVARPSWEGESLEGKTILLYAEQGTGDAIHFLRFAKRVKSLGATVLMSWEQIRGRGDLRPILKKAEYIDRLIDLDKEELYEDYDFDYHQSLSSLPRVFKIHSEEEFWDGSYIEPDTEYDPEYWKPYEGKTKVGIIWAGSASYHRDPQRSYPVTRFAPFIRDDVQLFSLQKDTSIRTWPDSGKVDLAKGMDDMPIVDLGPMMHDWGVTANLINKMDVIVSVDTASAHLAGAMGKEVLLMLPKVSDWRWGRMSEKTAWYPSMRVFRWNASQFEQAAQFLNYKS